MTLLKLLNLWPPFTPTYAPPSQVVLNPTTISIQDPTRPVVSPFAGTLAATSGFVSVQDPTRPVVNPFGGAQS